ncbi:glycosyl hydrolase family 8 [Fontibacillus phaseoli]|uniref:Glycosyl hydrolase family 8 n=1 Tax=Fontibacillus phaseoli TaxID=1416533 RepID=A0A369BN81_9BACL|nr:glycosyl hydrolase [Fontibacillus phaseoli]RCX23003.1 glycosyl hydrolase family 8 [Fontibacillus phaseoli]
MKSKPFIVGQRKNALFLIIILALVLAITAFLFIKKTEKKTPSSTIAFVEKHMTNPNGTLASYLQDFKSDNPDIVAGREALSESLGFWMQTAVLNKDKQRFDGSLELLQELFVSPQNYVYWKLRPDGKTEVNTNALGDDFRVIGALLDAYDLWQEKEVLDTAEKLTQTLRSSVTVDGYFVDYHDFKHESSADALSLAYVDTAALQAMQRHGLVDRNLLEKHTDLLLNMPNDGAFFPKTFQVTSRKYRYDQEINLIDQLIVAIHRAELGESVEPLTGFLKQELTARNMLPGRYDRETREPSVKYESPAVYGLAILLAYETKDRTWAEQLYPYMIAMRDNDPNFEGGYVFDRNSHLFDNLVPLLAEICYLRNASDIK